MSSPAPPRVCIVTTSYPTGEGDPAGHFVAAEAAELRRAGAEVTIVRPEPGGAFGWPGAAARIRERPWRLVEAAAWASRAVDEVRRARPDRVIAQWSVPSGWPIATSAGRASLGSAELELVSHGGDVRLLLGLPALARREIVRALASRADRWRFVAEHLLASLAAGLEARERAAVEAIAIVAPSPLGDVRVSAGAVSARRAELGGRPLYVCAGRLVPSKRVDKVIDYVASTHVANARRELAPVLVVLGDGPQRAQLEKQAQRWRIDARFLGTTPRHEALAWIGAADEVVHASLAEGLSTVLREAEHLGVKVTRL